MPEFKKGDVVEGYRILSELGRGAASVIYLVQDPKSKQVWALKHVEKHEPKEKRFLEQAEAEYRIARELNHPGIRKIVKVVKKSSGLINVSELFLVMELVDGVSMERTPPRTFVSAVHTFWQVAEALSHMHDLGYVHADMKPNNIIVSSDGTAKIIDLGQSCKIGTVKPRIQGTPDFIAPEQVHRRPITPATDIYNLGATMYYVLTRRHIPTAMVKPGSNSLVSTLDDSMVEKPVPAREINPRIPAKLDELIMQCVEVVPEKRPPNMAFVADRLNLIEGILRAKESNGQPTIEDED